MVSNGSLGRMLSRGLKSDDFNEMMIDKPYFDNDFCFFFESLVLLGVNEIGSLKKSDNVKYLANDDYFISFICFYLYFLYSFLQK